MSQLDPKLIKSVNEAIKALRQAAKANQAAAEALESLLPANGSMDVPTDIDLLWDQADPWKKFLGTLSEDSREVLRALKAHRMFVSVQELKRTLPGKKIWLHLIEEAALEHGFPKDSIFVLRNGQVLAGEKLMASPSLPPPPGRYVWRPMSGRSL